MSVSISSMGSSHLFKGEESGPLKSCPTNQDDVLVCCNYLIQISWPHRVAPAVADHAEEASICQFMVSPHLRFACASCGV